LTRGEWSVIINKLSPRRVTRKKGFERS